MRTTAGTLVLATSLGLGGLATGIVVAPAMATAATSEATAGEALGQRVTRLQDALKGLVADKTLTQAQADKVATTLAEARPPRGDGRGHGRGPGGPRLDAAATALGMTPAELRTQLRAGKTLAQVAESQGISEAALVDALVAAAEKALAEAVAAGRLTQAQADARTADLRPRITEMVGRAQPTGGQHGQHGPRGPRGSEGDSSEGDSSDGSDDSATDDSAAPA